MQRSVQVALAAIVLASAPAFTLAATVTTAAPAGATAEIGSRIRWGASGFEASIFDSNPFGQTPTLNPGGTPVWQLNNSYNFSVGFQSSTGTLTLKVDFDRSNSFEAGETISRSVFGGATTDYTGLGFRYISISGNEAGSTARSTVSNLVINGDSQSAITPSGALVTQFYKDSGNAEFTNILITGAITFLTSGTSQERPSYNFTLLSGPAGGPTPIPLPSAALAGGLALATTLTRRVRRA